MSQRKLNPTLIAKFFLFPLCLALVLLTGDFKPGLTQSPEAERKLNVRTFTRMPLKVKEVRNLQKEEDWFRDLEIEVENTSRQPIYFISLTIEFPDIPAPPPETRADGSTPSRSTTGFWLTFGSLRLGDIRKLATRDDISLKPGETYVFKVPDGWVQGFESMKKNGKAPPEATKRLEMEFNIISFGDGTGYVGGQRMLYSKKKSSGAVR